MSPPAPVSGVEGPFLTLPDEDDASVRRAPLRRTASERLAHRLPAASGDESWPWRSLATAPDGFMAPVPAEAEGEGQGNALGANGTGWLIGIGGNAARSFPRAMAMAYRAFPLCCLGPSLAQMFHLPGLPGALAAGFAPLLGFFAAAKLTADARLCRQMALTPPSPTLADPAPGTLVRVRGLIVDQPTIPSLFRGRPAVLTRNRVGPGEETRGIDFWLQDAAGQRLRVQVRGAFLLDRPTRLHDLPICDPVSCDWSNWTGPRLRPHLPTARPLRHRLLPPRLFESAVGPGDEIEVCGLVERETGPEGVARPGRGTPLYWALRGSARTPLLVRRAPQ